MERGVKRKFPKVKIKKKCFDTTVFYPVGCFGITL